MLMLIIKKLQGGEYHPKSPGIIFNKHLESTVEVKAN